MGEPKRLEDESVWGHSTNETAPDKVSHREKSGVITNLASYNSLALGEPLQGKV